MSTRPDLAGLIGDLAAAGVDFVLCGGAACVLHGVERVTMDIDIRVPDASDNYVRLVGVLKSRGMVPRISEPMENLCDPACREAWVRDKGALFWTALSPDGMEQVDVFLSYPVSWDDLANDAWIAQVRGNAVKISSRKHLIQAKRAVTPPRRKDLRDIEDLEALP